ncbi:sensor histidine kinase [Altericista sp. CCNU0014]|uniref:sensor histidine kinase n=1 Tax=Altericista sp. CCNU0014 TaxID=3082949 RepID=UPI00384D8AD1
MAMFSSRRILQFNRKLNALLESLPISNLGSTAPSRLLLNLEWLLLGFSVLTMLLTASLVDSTRIVLLSLLGVAAIAGMRLKWPRDNLFYKIFYTVLELGFLITFSVMDSAPPVMPLLGLVIVIRGCQMFDLTGRLVVSFATFAAFTLTILQRNSLPTMLVKAIDRQAAMSSLTSLNEVILTIKLNAALSFGLALVLVMLLINALLEERQSRVKLTMALDRLRQYSLRIEDQSALQERNRIAREIHDSLGHTLTAQSIQLDSALFLQRSNPQEASVFLEEAKQLCKQALHEVRQSVATLRTDPLQGKSLEHLMRTLLQEFRATTTIEPTCMLSLTLPLPREVISAYYRVLQEALTNIIRHSAASEVILSLVTRDRLLHLQIQDNGKGFNPDQNSTGFGIQGMKERIAALGGQFNLSSSPGEGCLIDVKVLLAIDVLP